MKRRCQIKTETLEVRDPATKRVDCWQRRIFKRAFGLNDPPVLSREIANPGKQQAVTEYKYYTNPKSPGYRRLRQVLRPSGDWRLHEYGDQGYRAVEYAPL